MKPDVDYIAEYLKLNPTKGSLELFNTFYGIADSHWLHERWKSKTLLPCRLNLWCYYQCEDIRIERCGLKVVVAAVLALFLYIGQPLAHSTLHPQHGDYTVEEVAWMKRQKAVDGTWCCGPENVTLIEDPHFRVRQNRWEVHLVGQWVPVPPGRMFRHNPDDPSPFAETFVFFSTHREGITIWCFRTPTGG